MPRRRPRSPPNFQCCQSDQHSSASIRSSRSFSNRSLVSDSPRSLRSCAMKRFGQDVNRQGAAGLVPVRSRTTQRLRVRIGLRSNRQAVPSFVRLACSCTTTRAWTELFRPNYRRRDSRILRESSGVRPGGQPHGHPHPADRQQSAGLWIDAGDNEAAGN
jgi:hypothetical protein